MTRQDTPRILTGATVGLILAAPLLAVVYMGERLLNLPLLPLDVFDFIVPLIPGGLIVFVINIMVDSLIALGFGSDVDSIAKSIEQGIGFVMIAVLMGAVGAAGFGLMRRQGGQAIALGGVLGAIVGGALTPISLGSPFLSVGPIVASVWLVGLFAAWGVALGWIYRDLRDLPPAFDPALDAEIEPRVEQMTRREFIVRVGGAAATLTVVGSGLGLALGERNIDSTTVAAVPTPSGDTPAAAPTSTANNLPNSDAAVQPPPGMRPEYTPIAEHYRIDIATRPIQLDPETWTLPFMGLVSAERALSLQQLREYPSREEYITMQCISNRIGGSLISTTKWTGVPVRDVLAGLDIGEDATHLRLDGADNFFEYISLADIMADESIMFCYAWDDAPLPAANGAPLRVYVPDLYGMKQPKWITSATLVSEDSGGYWVRRGWSQTARMKTTSVIDVVATDAITTDEAGVTRVPIGGYALAGARGISRVEVSIDQGEWTEALLREPLSDKTWVFWRYDWAFTSGSHEVQVRAFDGAGNLQPTEPQDPRPDGASGIHSQRFRT